MASGKPVVASGADLGEAVRRRPAAPGQVAPVEGAPQVDDKKKIVKKVRPT